jgi:3-hydroxyisobutyrate dehydrogenase-like beta-hydroxyacid dehydrogenase
MTRIGFVGAGRMGEPMVRRLVGAGHEVRVLRRTDEKAEAVTELDVVILCLFTDDQVRQLCFEDGLAAAMAPGAVLVNHTTGSPRTAEELAATGMAVVDAPVSGGPHDVEAGTITLFVGGEDDVVARVRPLLSVYGNPVLHVGGVGAGQLVKLVNNTMFAAQIGVVTEGVRLAARLGIVEPALLNALTHGSADSRALDSIARTGSTEAFIDTVGEFIGKDVAVIRQTVAELGADLGGLEEMVNTGLGK